MRTDEVTLASLVAGGFLALGDGYRTKRSELGLPGLPVLRVAEVLDGRIEPAFGDHVRESYRDKIGGKTSRARDVVLTTKGTVGRVALLNEDNPEFVYSPQVCYLRVLDQRTIRPEYIYYWCRSPLFRRQAAAVSGQTDMAAYINLADLRAMRIPLPSIEDQDRVVRLLTDLDDKVRLNASILNNSVCLLRATFQAVMAPGFVHLSDGARLPLGWTATNLGSVLAEAETGSRPKGGVGGITSGVPTVGAESISGLGEFDYSKLKFVPDGFFAAMRRGVVRDRDVLLYKDGGRPGNFEPHVTIVGEDFPLATFAINEHVYRLRGATISQEFLYSWLDSPQMMEEMRRRGTGVAIPGLNATALRGMPVLLPSTTERDAFDELAAPLITRALGAARETRTLTLLREALVPPLMAGRVPVGLTDELGIS